MTERARPGKYGDYLHALAVRVLHEDRLLQPRRAALFETEFAGPTDIGQLPSFAAVEGSESQRTMPPAGTVPAPRPATAPPPIPAPPRPPRVAADAQVSPRIMESRLQSEPAAKVHLPAAAPPTHTDRGVVGRDTPSPVALPPKAALLLPQVVHVPMPPPTSATPRHAAVPPAVAAPARVPAPVAATVVAPRTSLRREPQPGVMVAHPVPGMRNLAPLFPAAQPAAKEPPAVEITIGRLEIRATAAKAPAASPRYVPPPPHHTLKEYLTGKTGGRP